MHKLVWHINSVMFRNYTTNNTKTYFIISKKSNFETAAYKIAFQLLCMLTYIS